MSRAQMGRAAPALSALRDRDPDDWRFIIGVEGHAPSYLAGREVHGVLWRVGARELAAINAYENLDSGLYARRIVPIRHGARLFPALVYILRRPGTGRPRPAYVHLVVAAARDWGLPEPYVDALRRWSPSGWRGTRAKDTGEIR